jgi:hypothetical protein
MKAIYSFKPQLCVVIEHYGDLVTLEPIDGNEDQRFTVNLSDPNLVLDPTDDEVAEVRE